MIREVIHQILNCMGTTKGAAKYDDHEVTSRLVLCQPSEERARREKMIYIQRHTARGQRRRELKTITVERADWKKHVGALRYLNKLSSL